MTGWKLILLLSLLLFIVGLSVYMLYSQLVDIYFNKKLEYTSKVIGGLGKALGDIAERMGESKKD